MFASYISSNQFKVVLYHFSEYSIIIFLKCCLLFWTWPPPTHCRQSKACSAYMHLLSVCLFIHLCVSLSICLCDINHLSACPQICESHSIFCSTRKHSCAYISLHFNKIILIATSGDTETCYTQKKENFSDAEFGCIYSTAQRHERKITVSMCCHCGDKQCQWLALQWFGSFGFCGD